MDTIAYLQKQFANLNNGLHGLANDLTADEWMARPIPGQNLIGFLAWHLPRTQDMFVQTWIRGETEVAHTDRWQGWKPLKEFGIGAGVTLEEADAIAHTVSKAEVLEYADEVYQTISDWLGECGKDALEQCFDYHQRLAVFPEYQTPGFTREVKHLFNRPVWDILMRPCTTHIYRHQGEIEVVKEMLRRPR
ncbi:MAG: DinB family protein [Chloroflexi bacterium]|nr:DinB family protein [Chloroflexota bacterium]OJV92799.1 MAG: hypothetical protein BGO39_30010 [Chloroflexi bacterium 54-19]